MVGTMVKQCFTLPLAATICVLLRRLKNVELFSIISASLVETFGCGTVGARAIVYISIEDMSLTFSCDHGWIISHLKYVNDIYKNITDQTKLCDLEFNRVLFDINTKYLRQNQYAKATAAQTNDAQSKTRKRKRNKEFPREDFEQMTHIQRALDIILSSAKEEGLFKEGVVCDNNEAARSFSQSFYAESFRHHVENLHGCNKTDKAIISETQAERYVFPEKCAFYCYDVRNIEEKMEMNNQFDFIILDPPWWNKSIRRKKSKCSEASYKMMYNEELAKIPVNKLLSSSGIVAVWCTNAPSHLRSIFDEMFPAWGVTYRAKWYWVKVTNSGETICDFIPPPGKQPYELLVIGAVSSNKSITIPDGKLIVSVPSAVHSHKPPLIELIKSYLPTKPNCLEIFARYLLPGWTSWGLEVLKFQHLSLYSIIRKNESHTDVQQVENSAVLE